jgi:hypothetical protein
LAARFKRLEDRESAGEGANGVMRPLEYKDRTIFKMSCDSAGGEAE